LADKLSWGVKETTVALGSDHAGLTLKNEIIAYLQKRGLNAVISVLSVKKAAIIPISPMRSLSP